ncbi:MAG: 2OG-Fe(II) oxygenase, partial [Pseudolabrys sp.]
MQQFRLIGRGDPAPLFTARSTVNPEFRFETVGGRFILMAFLGTLTDQQSTAALKLVHDLRPVFDDEHLAFFGVVASPADAQSERFKELSRSLRFFLDFDCAVSRDYGCAPSEIGPNEAKIPYQRRWVLIDPMLRIVAVVPFQNDGGDLPAIRKLITDLPPLERFPGFDIHPPILVLPDIFETELCKHLIGLYETHGGEESGFMREVNGKTVPALNAEHKRRADYTISDPELIRLLQGKVQRRVVPEIAKAHQFKVTRMERYIVGCYDSGSGGHFRAHRDNTTKGTAHRRFALSV